MGNRAEYDSHGEITEDNTNKSATYNSGPAGRQRTKKPCWCKKADVWQKIFGNTIPTTTPTLKPPLTDTGNHTFELTGQKTGDTASDHAIAMQTEDWIANATIYTDGAVTHGNLNGRSGIIVTTGPHRDPRVHHQCTLLSGKWCSCFQAEEKAVRTALILVLEDVSLHRVRIISVSCQLR